MFLGEFRPEIRFLPTILTKASLTQQYGSEFWTNASSNTIHHTPQRDATNATITLAHREAGADYPEWQYDMTFPFEQFRNENDLNKAKSAMLGVISMLQTAMAVMYPGTVKIGQPWPPPRSSESLERYFFFNNIPWVAEEFKRLLAALGAPSYEELLSCYHAELLTLKVVFGDYWRSVHHPLCQNDPKYFCLFAT